MIVEKRYTDTEQRYCRPTIIGKPDYTLLAELGFASATSFLENYSSFVKGKGLHHWFLHKGKDRRGSFTHIIATNNSRDVVLYDALYEGE